MRELTLEDIGVDLDRVIRLLGGEEKILQQTMENMVRRLGEEKVRQQMEQILEKLSTNKAS